MVTQKERRLGLPFKAEDDNAAFTFDRNPVAEGWVVARFKLRFFDLDLNCLVWFYYTGKGELVVAEAQSVVSNQGRFVVLIAVQSQLILDQALQLETKCYRPIKRVAMNPPPFGSVMKQIEIISRVAGSIDMDLLEDEWFCCAGLGQGG